VTATTGSGATGTVEPALGSDPRTAAERGSNGALLQVEDLVVRFQTHEATVYAVNGVTFQLEQGETLGLVGESGCGKSVTSLALTRLLPKPAGRIEQGRVLFAGRNLLDLSEDELREVRGEEIAMVFQDPLTSLNPVITIGTQMTEGMVAHEKLTQSAANDRAVELLQAVGIPDGRKRLKSYPHQLSGGMRQRVMIAMALALKPRLLIADEPTTALDVTIQAQVMEVIRQLTEQSGTAVLIITHDLGVVADLTKRICVMYAGFVVETATTPELFAHPHHPYTVGLLNSISRIDAENPAELHPIEGAPPDGTREPSGCPFAPRCAWRLPKCWTDNPALTVDRQASPALTNGAGELPVIRSGSDATHLLACHNPATDDEARAGRPLREGFLPARPPASGPSIDANSQLEAPPTQEATVP
jgi:oligopeptide/dipeptide ABC transporter ATP-binding protein